MLPYVAMLAVPSLLALTGTKRAGLVLLLLVALFYWLMIGFRFQVGMDWNNYIFIYQWMKEHSLAFLLLDREPGYGLLNWLAAKLGWGTIFINATSALVFCSGFFAVASRCREPWLAVTVATPLLVIAFAMSGARQALACGLIFYLFATWERRGTVGRAAFVLFAMLFHFSAIFVLAFVALASNAPPVLRFAIAAAVAIMVVVIIRFAPEAMESYSRLYVGSQSKLSAPGAIVQVGVLAVAAVAYLLNGQPWARANGDSGLYRQLAWATLLCLPLILISSVGAYRFALYFWPMAMYVYSGFPALIELPAGRALYRMVLVAASFAMLIGWLLLANNSLPWFPYRNWLLEPDGVSLIRRSTFRRS